LSRLPPARPGLPAVKVRDYLELAGRAALQLGWNGLEAAAGRIRPGALPGDVGQVTPAWLTRALQPIAEGVVVSRVDADGFGSGTTARARLALSYEGPGRRADLPDTLFLKLAPRDLPSRLFVSLFGLGRSEVAFYRSAREGLPVRAPQVYFAAAAPRGARFALLLEDLGASGCRFADVTAPSDPERAGAVMRALARLHAAFWESPRLTGDLAALRRASPGDSLFRLGRILCDLSLRPALRRFGELVPEELQRSAGFIAEHRLVLESLWARPPLTLIHGDAHLGNLFFDGPEVGFLDWQVAQPGQGLRDVTYFLTNSLSVETRRAHGEELIRVYLAALAEAGAPPVPFSLAWEQHRLHALYTWIACIVTAAAATLQQESVVRAGLERSSAAVLELDSLGALREQVGG
jgi:Phosphotransferase enzyme family